LRISLQDLIGLIRTIKVFYLLIGNRDQSKENERKTWYLFQKLIFWLHLHLHGSLEPLTAQTCISMPRENLLLVLQFSASEICQSHSASQILITKGFCFKSAQSFPPLLKPVWNSVVCLNPKDMSSSRLCFLYLQFLLYL